MTAYAIGDVQGCFASLQALLQKIQFRPNQDCLIFLGDLVNRGPQSLATLRFITELPNKYTVLGNHDLHLIALAHGLATDHKHTLTEVLSAADAEQLIAWLCQQPFCLHYQNYYIAHAGFYPLWTPDQAMHYASELQQLLQQQGGQTIRQLYGNQPARWQPELAGMERARFMINAFTRMRFINQAGYLELDYKGAVGGQPAGFFPWYDYQAPTWQDKTILFGHWAALQGHTGHAKRIALDTGCSWGQQLTALRLDDGQHFSVPAQETTFITF